MDVIPAASSRARTNASTGESSPVSISDRAEETEIRTGWNDQCGRAGSWPSDRAETATLFLLGSSTTGLPAATHCRMIAIEGSGNLPPGGIFNSS